MLSISIKKDYSFSTFPSSNLQNFEDSGIVLAVYVSQFQEYCSWALTAQAHKMVITTVCVDNCFCYTWIVFHLCASLRWFGGTLFQPSIVYLKSIGLSEILETVLYTDSLVWIRIMDFNSHSFEQAWSLSKMVFKKVVSSARACSQPFTIYYQWIIDYWNTYWSKKVIFFCSHHYIT